MDTSAASALGQQLTDFLLKQFGASSGAGDTLGFLGTGISVDPDSFLSQGEFNAARVNAWLDIVVDPIGSINSDGNRVQSTPWTATQLMDTIANQAMSLAPPGGAEQQGFAHVKSSAAQALGGDTTVHTAPIDWYDPAIVAQWPKCTLDSTNTNSSGNGSGVTQPQGGNPSIKPIWAWRNLPQVVLPTTSGAPTSAAPAVSEHNAATLHPIAGVPRLQIDSVTPTVAAAPRPATVTPMAIARTPAATAAQSRLVHASDLARTISVEQPASVANLHSTLRISRAQVVSIAQAISTVGEQATTTSVDSESLSLSFSYLVVQLSRANWWNDLLLLMSDWCVAGFERGAFVPESGAGNTVGVPIALVLTRDVQIQAVWSANDRSNATSSTNFGPWSLSTSQMSETSAQGKASLTIPGMQAIACIYRQLPALPPASDPALASARVPNSLAPAS